MSSSRNLDRARSNKNDEFYTLLSDIESELKHYKNHFKDKVVYCNADDPRVSNFFHYFSHNFEHLGLRKLITTCYENQEQESAIALVYEGEKDNGRVPAVEDIGVIELSGDGDFRSPEAIEFLKEADVVVTNPPFSLFREFISLLVENNKKFLVIGNKNAITYKETFSLIKDNRLWLGITSPKEFMQPDGTIKKFGNINWFTNLEIDKRNEELSLYRKYYDDPKLYPKYDNYDAIEVSRVKNIPMDYYETMGVPITFMNKFNPEQFEIIKFRKGNDDKDLVVNGKCPYFRIIIKRKQK